MMRKHNKLIMLLVLVTFMFTMVGSAGAASYSDVTGTSTEASAISRLSGLGVLEGYPDGTFGPEKTITRAEFAKIACVTAGLKSVASGMGGTASTFSDVTTDHWANGWINVAAAQGFVKGYPDGTYQPEGKITQAEVITVLLRLLGFNDNLPGNWPSDYIAKAANLGILDDITFVANADATRGVVAVLASATLDENVVEYAASDNLFNEILKDLDGNGTKETYTLLYDKFNESAKYKDALAIQFRYDSDGDTYLQYFQYNKDQNIVLDSTGAAATAAAANLQEKKLSDNCVFSGGGSILTVIENFVEFDVNEDDEISSIIVKDYGSVGPKLSAVSLLTEVKVESGKAKANDKTYSFLAPAQVVQDGIFPTEFIIAAGAFIDGTYNSSDVYRLILNKDGKVAGLKSTTLPTPGIVDKVVGERIYYMDNATPLPAAGTPYVSQGNFTDEDIYVQRDGKPATLADIQPLDTINVVQGYRGTDYYVIATSLKIAGKLESAEYSGTDVKKVKVMGMKWTVPYTNFNFLVGAPKAYTARYSVDNGVEIEGNLVASTLDSEYDLWNSDVKVLTSATGKAAGVVFGEGASASKMYGVITEITSQMAWNDGTTVRNIKLMKSDGDEYSYPICDNTYIKIAGVSTKIKDLASLATIDDSIQTKDLGAATITLNSNVEKLVSVSLKSSGLVDRIEVINQADQAYFAANVDSDNKLVKIGGIWVDATDVVVFNLNNNVAGPAVNINTLDETKVVGWTEFKNASANYAAWYVNSNNKLQYVVINDAPLSTGDKYAIYKEAYSDADDWVIFVGQDAIQRSALVAGVKKGDVVHYTMSGSEANVDVRTIPYGTKSNVSVDKISGQTILLDKVDANGLTSYKTDEDTVYFDVKKDTNLQVLDAVSVGDSIIVIPDAVDGSLAAAVVVVEFDGTAPTVSSVTATSVVFSEAVRAATAIVAGNYAISGTAVDAVQTVTAAALGADGKTVTLTFSAPLNVTAGNTLTVTVTGVKDVAGNTIAGTNTGTKTF